MGPVIEAIDAGHIERTPEKGKAPYCGECRTPWPCPDIVAARQKQQRYADDLRKNNLLKNETARRTYA